MAIDPSGWRVLLVSPSLVLTHLQGRCSVSFHTIFFFSLTTDINRTSQNPQVPEAQPGFYESDDLNVPGVRVLLFCFVSGCVSIPIRLQSMATLKEGDELQMWEFIRV